MIISESTHSLVKDEFPTHALGEVIVKGKAIPVRIYAVLALGAGVEGGTQTTVRPPEEVRSAQRP